jgi:ribosomal protein S18 acetylase RimI-like enzyme
MKVKFRHSNSDDLDSIYNLHCRCFAQSDQWYQNFIKPFLNSGIVVEYNNDIIGVLLQGKITACNPKLETNTDMNYKEDIFEPVNETGINFEKDNLQYTELFGITMICVDPKYRGKGLAQKLIQKHLQSNPNKILCLHTRRSNIGAYLLYKKMGYEHIAYVKNKYFQPNEDSIFMIKTQ